MRILLLGPVEVDGSGALSPRDRVVVAALAIRAPDVLAPESIADAVWGENPPKSWAKVVQGSVVRLRQLLGRSAVETTSAGYRLAVAQDDIDARYFERLLDRGRSLQAAAEHDRAAAVYAQALRLWRGPALGDLERWLPGRTEATRLDEMRHAAQESLVAAELAGGRDVVAAATALVAEQPLRERRWYLLATALYRSDRQADALGALRQARRTMRDELGLDPSPDLAALEVAILAHAPGLAAPISSAPASASCPYQGLAAYDREDADWFFGRDQETSACLRALADMCLLVVAGPSGSGKSSLVRAGVAPALEQVGRPVSVLTPAVDPESALTTALAAHDATAVIVIDQFEELFTVGLDQALVVGFLDRVAQLASRGRRVITVVRGDQVGRLSASVAFARLAERGLHLVTPMSADDLREAIVAPARQAGLRLEPGLVELLLRDIVNEPGALPLLSHALAETWARREANVLTVEGYQASGGVRGAVAQTAERVFEALAPEQRVDMRAILLRLVAVPPGGEPVSTRVSSQQLGSHPERRRVLDLLVRSRLVTMDDRSVGIAHEALVRAWPRLRSWLDEDAAGQRILRHLSVAAQDWHEGGQPDSELYRGSRLAAATDWRRGSTPDLTAVESAFLDRSAAVTHAEADAVRARQAQQARQAVRLRSALVVTVGALIVALLAGGLAVRQTRQSSAAAAAARLTSLQEGSVALRGSQRDLAALLAVQAYRRRPDAASRSALFGVLTGSPGFLGYRPTAPARTLGPALVSGHLLADEHTLLAAGIDGAVSSFDLDRRGSGQPITRPELAASGADLAVSSDGSVLAVVAWQGTDERGGLAELNVVDLPSGHERATGVGLSLDAGAVAVSPDGRHLAVSGHVGGRVQLYDLLPTTAAPGSTSPPGVALAREPPPLGRAQGFAGVRRTAALAFRRDGILVVGSEVGVVRLVDPSTGMVLRELTGAPELTSNTTITVSPDDSVLVTSGTNGVVRWDLDTGQPAWVQPLGAGRCATAVVATVVGGVLCGGASGRVETVALANGTVTGTRYDPQRGEVSALLLSADGTTLTELSASQGVVARWRLDGTGPVSRLLPVQAGVAQYAPDGRRLLVIRGAGSARAQGWGSDPDPAIVDARTGAVVDDLAGWRSAVWTRDPRRLVVWDARGTGSVIDGRTGGRVGQLQGGFGEPPDGGTAATNADTVLAWGPPDSGGHAVGEVWDTRTGDVVAVDVRPAVDGQSLSADGSLVVAAYDGYVAAFDVRARRRIAVRIGVLGAAVAPTGVVAASLLDGSLVFLDARTLEPAGPAVTGTFGRVAQFQFSHDGRVMVTRGSDGALRVFDLDERIELGEQIELQDANGTVAVRPDGRELAVPSTRGIILWDLDPAHWVGAACQIAGRDLTRQEWATYLPEAGAYRLTCPVT